MADGDGRRDHPDSEFVEAVEAGNRTASEIADYIGITRQAAHYRLRQLREEGVMTSDEVGNQLLWAVVDE